MNQSWGNLYTAIGFAVGYDPQNTGYKSGVRSVAWLIADELYAMKPWKFAFHNATIQARGDYATGTVTITNASRTVTGVGTAWEASMEPGWIAPGSDPDPADWVRIGRVAGTTTLYLVEPYPNTTYSGVYTIRFRYIPLPRDILKLDGIGPGENSATYFEYIAADEAIRRGFTERPPVTTGDPRAIIPAYPPMWAEGEGQPRTPEVAPTLTGVAGASSLVVGREYEYKYTWWLHGVETGSSPVASITVAGGAPVTRLTGLQECGATDGRYIRVYRRDKTSDLPFYRIGTYSNVSQVDDDGTVTDRAHPYYECSQITYVRPYPLPSTDEKYELDIRYHARPRQFWKDSDYLEMPGDAASYVQWGTIHRLATTKQANPAAAAAAMLAMKNILTVLEQSQISDNVQPLVRMGTTIPDRRGGWPWGSRNFRQLS